jgi:hypothetical protein
MGVIENSTHSLVFGDLIWVEEGEPVPDLSDVVYRVRAQDATLGAAVPVTTALLWLGRAGGPVAYDHTDNREPVFRITIEGEDSEVLARGERALQLQCEQPTTLTWTPPDGAGEPSVFDIMWSHLEPVFETDGLTGLGMEEAVVGTRTYLVRMQALPYARAQSQVVVTSLPAGTTATETVVDSGSSTTGWAAGSGTLAVTSGAVVNTTAVKTIHQYLIRSGTISLATARYVAVTWASSATGLKAVEVTLAGVDTKLPQVSRVAATGAFFTSFYRLPDGLASTTSLTVTFQPRGLVGTFSIDKVSTWTDLPTTGTARQKTTTLIPGGSVRTNGSIQVAHATSALGTVIVYSQKSDGGYLPPLSRWFAAGTTPTTDVTRMSGSYASIATAKDYRVPVTALPRGRVELWAWVRSSVSTEFGFYWAVDTWINNVGIGIGTYARTPLTLPANTWKLVCFGESNVPNVDIGPAGYVRVSVQRDALDSGVTVEVDETYLFATDEGRLTIVDCGTGTPSAGGPSNRLWIDAPSPDQPQGAIWRGNADDRSDAWHAGHLAEPWSPDGHELDPAGANFFVATSNASDALTSAQCYPRFNTFVSRTY